MRTVSPTSALAKTALLVTIALLGASIGAACSSSTSNGKASAKPSANSPQKMLLGVADLPAGWSAKPVEPITTDDISSDCLPRHAVTVSRPRAEADFTGAKPTDKIDEIIGVKEVSAAKTVIDSFRAGIGAPGCTTWTLGGPGLARAPGVASALPIANLGDGAAAVHWKASSGPAIAIDFVLIRKSGAVALITHIDEPTVDSAVTEKVAMAAAAKLG
jgi:hypothetical protein